MSKKNLICLAIFICLVFFLSALIPFLRAPLLTILEYPFSILTFVRREVGGMVFYHRNLIQNQRLKKEIDLLRHRLNTLDEINLENKRLTNLLFLKQKTTYKVLASRVIGRSADNWSSLIIIDKGRDSGIKSGMIAINYLGLVGRVIDNTASTSKIMLINDPSFSVSCLVQRSRQEGLVSGTLGSFLVMRYLPKDADIKVSDIIVTSGLTPLYPKGLLIGKVLDLEEEFSGLTLYALIKPAVDLSNLEEVLIIVQ